MKKIKLGFIVGIIFLSSCCPKVLPPKIEYKEVVKTEYVEKLRIDTIRVELPQEGKAIVTKDTISVLKIKSAYSTAKLSNGLLYHTLFTDSTYKPKVKVVYRDIEVVRDSIIVDKVVERVEVEKPLKWWQKGLMWIGGGALFLFILSIREVFNR